MQQPSLNTPRSRAGRRAVSAGALAASPACIRVSRACIIVRRATLAKFAIMPKNSEITISQTTQVWLKSQTIISILQSPFLYNLTLAVY